MPCTSAWPTFRSVLTLLLLAPSVAGAAEIFSCMTEQDDALITLSETNGALHYTYGPPTQPIISLQVPRQRARIAAWDGVDLYRTYLVAMRSGDTIYTVYTSYDDGHGFDTMGVTVEHRDVFMADYKCQIHTVKGDLAEYVLHNKTSVKRL